jgi:hypothetical protein
MSVKMRILKRIYRGMALGLLAVLMTTSIVLAVPSDITASTIRIIPTDTTLSLTWTKATSSTTTTIVYKTTGYSANVTDGTAFNTSKAFYILTGLTSGTNYYISLWGYDGANYSATPAQMMMTTNVAALAEVTMPTPTVSANFTQAPAMTGFNLSPFSDMIKYFNNSTGGLGMPLGSAAESLAIGGIALIGAIVYIKKKNFFLAWGTIFLLSCICVGIHVFQGYLVGIEIIIGAGVWSIDKYYQ